MSWRSRKKSGEWTDNLVRYDNGKKLSKKQKQFIKSLIKIQIQVLLK